MRLINSNRARLSVKRRLATSSERTVAAISLLAWAKSSDRSISSFDKFSARDRNNSSCFLIGVISVNTEIQPPSCNGQPSTEIEVPLARVRSKYCGSNLRARSTFSATNCSISSTAPYSPDSQAKHKSSSNVVPAFHQIFWNLKHVLKAVYWPGPDLNFHHRW